MKKSKMDEALDDWSADAAASLKRKSTQQADATRAPSGKTQKLGKDADRKLDVLASEGKSLGGGAFPTKEMNANHARSTAFWGRQPFGKEPTPQEAQRDANVEKVGESLDKTRAELGKSKAADRDKRNK